MKEVKKDVRKKDKEEGRSREVLLRNVRAPPLLFSFRVVCWFVLLPFFSSSRFPLQWRRLERTKTNICKRRGRTIKCKANERKRRKNKKRGAGDGKRKNTGEKESLRERERGRERGRKRNE